MAYQFQNKDIDPYEAWFQKEPGRSAAALEKILLQRVWSPCAPQRILEVGCGTGYFLEWFAGQGHQTTGLEPSPSGLAMARKRLPPAIQLDQGHAENLPYEDNAFDTVALITTLEFVEDPLEALAEACRVARRHVLLGTLNKFSIIALQKYWKRLWHETIYSKARFFSVWELKAMISCTLSGPATTNWKTGLTFPLRFLNHTQHLEKSRFFTWHPFGHFIAMRVDLHYPIQTVQNPIFSQIPSKVKNAQCSSCRQAQGYLSANHSTGQGNMSPHRKAQSSQRELCT